MSRGYYNPNHYIPNYAGNLTSAVLFSVLLIWGAVTGIYYKQWWFGTAFFLGSTLEVIGYIGRVLSSNEEGATNMSYYIWQIICLTMAPSFYMAGIYYLLAKFTVIYGKGISRLMPLWYSYIFIACDLLAIFIQGAGGAYTGSNSSDMAARERGTNILIAGLIVQLVGMCVFGILCIDFYIQIKRYKKKALKSNPQLQSLSKEQLDEAIYEPRYAVIRNKRPLFKIFVLCVMTATILIFIRSVFRTIEFVQGYDGYLRVHEIYMFVFDTICVFIAVFLLTVINPGMVFGRDTKIPVKTKLYKQTKKKLNDDSASNDIYDVELQER